MNTLKIFGLFLKLGCASFGGPAAHLGFFQQVFVEQKRWLTTEQYAQLIALSQFLPGPSSSQAGFAIGLHKGGILGACAAFVGFTLPSFLLLYFLATVPNSDNAYLLAATTGLKLFAVAVVLDAVITMGKNFCTTQTSVLVCLLTTVMILVIPHPQTQLLALCCAAVFGYVTCKEQSASPISLKALRPNKVPLLLFIILSAAALFAWDDLSQLIASFYYAGLFVFGGGHVVLPLLQAAVPHVSEDSFLVAYSAAQAVPGPMFSIATYLGAIAEPTNALLVATLATLAIFLPGFLLLLIVRESWHTLSQHPRFAHAMSLVNASVVGLLLAALYQPIFTSSVQQPLDLAIVLIGFICLRFLKVKILFLVLAFVTLGFVLHQ
ncbi:chromate efflux transporter [Pseudoalteromonas ulvae]|uniref:Chorismate-binding protein n=1 Tax=Pseudoalteromonas ulvae TaxID=107327 RepID=A0A244CL10_PSEDV|nr:chromate efflux transporter [Pseudoalteromonas ulvae]OUL56019.1 hypothetical protein B1199_20160 [Pseudoalteromonas ulvae]